MEIHKGITFLRGNTDRKNAECKHLVEKVNDDKNGKQMTEK